MVLCVGRYAKPVGNFVQTGSYFVSQRPRLLSCVRPQIDNATVQSALRPIPEDVDTTVETTFNRLLDAARRCGEKAAAAEAQAKKKASGVSPPLPGKATSTAGGVDLPSFDTSTATQDSAVASGPTAADDGGRSAGGSPVRRGSSPRERAKNAKSPVKAKSASSAGDFDEEHGLGLSLGRTLRALVNGERAAAKAAELRAAVATTAAAARGKDDGTASSTVDVGKSTLVMVCVR